MKRFLLSLLAGLLCLPWRVMTADASATNDPGRAVGKVTPLTATAGIARGEFHLLAIGIDRYLHVTPLATAANGVRALAGVLTNDYGFSRVTTLLDAQATRPNILRELRRVLLSNAGTNDSVLIYYAGHGQIDEQTQSGSWIPVEGLAPDPDNPASEAPSTWLSNSDIKTLIRASRARHILLVSDSCFSGDFLRTPRAVAPGDTPEALRTAHARPSRQALAAGGLEPVADQGGGDGQSAFTGPLLRLLREHDGAFVLPYHLHGRVADTLVMNARQRPQLGRIFDAGDEVGGEFIFFRHRLSLDEALADRERQKIQLAALAAAADQAEQERQTKIAAQQAELAKQDSEIAALRTKLKQSGAGGGLAQMVALLKQRESAAAELKRLEEEAVKAKAARETELARLRLEEVALAKTRFEKLYADYQLILQSPLMQDAEKHDAWLALCTELGVTPQGSRPGTLTFRDSDGMIVEEGVNVVKEEAPPMKKAASAVETPAIITVAKVAAPPAASVQWTKDNPFVNSLGMKFVPVPGTEVLFSIWETRRQDYEAFANAASRSSRAELIRQGDYEAFASTPSGVDGNWNKPGFPQAATHPVVNVNWEDAQKFAMWLTVKERREGRLTAQQSYRLPTDVEWSRAVGLTSEPGSTPKARDGAVKDVFPWGTQWPPPSGVGNYDSYSAIGPAIGPAPLQRRDRLAQGGGIGDSFESSKVRTDNFDRTCPVGGFPANQFGLFDLGGNALEWCEDHYDGSSGARVLRGGSWGNLARGLLLSSDRSSSDAESRRNYHGFRVVLAGTVGR